MMPAFQNILNIYNRIYWQETNFYRNAIMKAEHNVNVEHMGRLVRIRYKEYIATKN